MDIFSILNRMFSLFGFWGWWELVGAAMVVIGCAGEFWIIANKLTMEVEEVGKTAGKFWKGLAWIDRKLRPLLVKLKIRGRKISKTKEEMLERFFVSLVALGVGLELIAMPASLIEIAHLNEKAGAANRIAEEANERASTANKDAAFAKERAASNELAAKQLEKQLEGVRSNNLALQLTVEELRKSNAELAAQIEPRNIEEYGPAMKVKQFAGLNAVIISASGAECINLASQFRTILQLANWKVEPVVATSKEVLNGIRVGVCSTNSGVIYSSNEDPQLRSASVALVGALNDEGMQAKKTAVNSDTSLRFNGVLIIVGPKLSTDEADIFEIDRQIEEVQKLVWGNAKAGDKFWELVNKREDLIQKQEAASKKPSGWVKMHKSHIGEYLLP